MLHRKLKIGQRKSDFKPGNYTILWNMIVFLTLCVWKMGAPNKVHGDLQRLPKNKKWVLASRYEFFDPIPTDETLLAYLMLSSN
jgi:hypothetical protein